MNIFALTLELVTGADIDKIRAVITEHEDTLQPDGVSRLYQLAWIKEGTMEEVLEWWLDNDDEIEVTHVFTITDGIFEPDGDQSVWEAALNAIS